MPEDGVTLNSSAFLTRNFDVQVQVNRNDTSRILVATPQRMIIALSLQQVLDDTFRLVRERLCDDPQLGQRGQSGFGGGADWVPLEVVLRFQVREEVPRY